MMRGRAFAQAIKDRGHTQETFAKLIGRSTRTISRWSQAERIVPQEIELLVQKLKRRRTCVTTQKN